MKKIMLALNLLPLMLSGVLLGATAFADQGELDHEKDMVNRAERLKDLPPTLVIRVDEKTKAVAVANLKDDVAIPEQLKASDVAAYKFAPVNQSVAYSAANLGVAELNRDNSRESWYFTYYYNYPYAYPTYYYPAAYPTYGYGFYPTYSYYGYNYNYYPYGAYANPGYTYYYYSPYAFHRRWR